MFISYFKLAFRNLRQKKLRSWLTMVGIFISIATIFTLISLSLGLQGAIEEQFRVLGTDKFFIQPATGFLGPPGSIPNVLLTEDDVEFIAKQRGVKDYSYFVAGNAKIEYGGQERYMLVWGVPPEHQEIFFEMSSFKIDEGNFLEDGDRNKIITGILHRETLWKKELQTGSVLIINGKEFKVKGILQKIGNPDDDRIIMMDIDSFRELFGVENRVDYIIIQINDGENIKEVIERVEKKLRNFKGETEKTQTFDIMAPEDLLDSFKNILAILTAFLGGIAAISLLVGGVGIANTMYTSVLERTKEIGTMKAVGAKNKDILWIFLIESGLLGLVGSGIGVMLGYGISKSIEWYAVTQLNTNLLQVSAPLYLVLGCLAFGFLIGAFSGVLPAWQASKIKVVDALRYE